MKSGLPIMNQMPIVADQFQSLSPNKVEMKGLIGKRFDVNRINRLHYQEEYHLLWPFLEHCPVRGEQDSPPHPEITRGDWQGEFIGTWLDAACRTAWYSNDGKLREKIDHIIDNWLDTQGEDGYLGTYDEKDRWKSWDIWIQAHDLIGLISYYRYTGSGKAINAALRIADRVLKDFGPGRNCLHNGPHEGMASSAILEPMIWLYWESGENRFLAFAQWLVDQAWEAPGGPKIISSLISRRGVAKTANAKAAEMLICCSGLVELYRATGNPRYIEPVLLAWEDIVQHHLYITGSASTGEYFQTNFSLRNDGIYRLGETCVTMTWLYLNLNLGRLTGEGRFFDMTEQTLYNHLLGAQSPDGRGWAYYMGLRDSKRFRWHTDPDCCPTRGVRALAQIPENIMHVAENGLAINFYEPSKGILRLSNGADIEIDLHSNYPFDGNVLLKIGTKTPMRFKLYLRLPGWCENWQIRVNGKLELLLTEKSGNLVIDRAWKDGDQIELKFEMPVKVVIDNLGNDGRVALVRGPLVFAADSRYLPNGKSLDDVTILLNPNHPADGILVEQSEEPYTIRVNIPILTTKPISNRGIWKVKERYLQLEKLEKPKIKGSLPLVPFFEAGSGDDDSYKDGVWSNFEAVTKVTFQVWLPYQIS
jgi:uncharacterized protein